MSPARAFHELAEQLRHTFDQGFQVPPPPPAEQAEELLCLEVGEARYAVRLGALQGVFEMDRLTFLPSSSPHLVGLAGLRGEVVPVFDLASLLGRPRASGARWLLASRGEPPLALAVAELAGRVRLSTRDLKEGGLPEGMTLLDLPALVEALRTGRSEPPHPPRSTP